MFVYSVRASTVKFFSVIILTLLLLVGVLIFSPFGEVAVYAASEKIEFGGMKTNDDRVNFIKGFGWEIDEVPIEEVTFSVPENFDRIIAGYSEIQKTQGLDLSKYKNKKVTRYTYNVKNYEEYDGSVVVNLIIYRGTVIACDISSLDAGGFVLPLVKL